MRWGGVSAVGLACTSAILIFPQKKLLQFVRRINKIQVTPQERGKVGGTCLATELLFTVLILKGKRNILSFQCLFLRG